MAGPDWKRIALRALVLLRKMGVRPDKVLDLNDEVMVEVEAYERFPY